MLMCSAYAAVLPSMERLLTIQAKALGRRECAVQSMSELTIVRRAEVSLLYKSIHNQGTWINLHNYLR